MFVWVHTFEFIIIDFGSVCKWVNLANKDRSIRVFIFKSINTLCNDKIFKIDNIIYAEFIQLV